MTNGRSVGLGEGWRRLQNRRELAQAFFERPWGPHHSDLQAIVNAMRFVPVSGKFAVQCVVPFASWRLVRLPLRRGLPLEPVDGRLYTSLADAERAVFAQRWEAMFGETLDWRPESGSAAR